MTRETFLALLSLIWLLSGVYFVTLAVVLVLYGRAYIPVPVP